MSFFARTHVIDRSQTLTTFLTPLVQPWRWDIMLKNGGIRADRQGKAITPLAPGTALNTGDIVTIDDAFGVTSLQLRRKASTDFRDLVFSPQRGKDPSLNNQVTALLEAGPAFDVPLTVVYLRDLVAQLIPLGTYPIRHI